MFKKISKFKLALIILIISAAFFRFYRLDYPKTYVFDEVYHAFTAKEYLKGNKAAWDPWATPPKGVAYEWLHPPIEKEIMTVSMFILHSTEPWAWRVPGAILGILSVFLVFKLAELIFKDRKVALLSAFIFSIDGLVFVQSRTGMNDVYLVAFSLISVIFFIRQRFLLSAIFLGVAIATKWPGVFLYPIFGYLILRHKLFKQLTYFVFIPPAIYLLSYLPYFLLGYNWANFIELHRQIWGYQTHLKATHDYASPWWSWPLNLYPVWYFVEYKNNMVANIFASGNPLIFWAGSAAIILTLYDAIKKRAENLLLIVAAFAVFWLPWSISPRIMFLYHFSPSVPFLSMALAYQLSPLYSSNRKLLFIILGLFLITFLLLYPMLTGEFLLRDLMQVFFKSNLTKNPFGQ